MEGGRETVNLENGEFTFYILKLLLIIINEWNL